MVTRGFLLTSVVQNAILVLSVNGLENDGNMRTWIKQLPGKKNCGVIAVAVIAGVTLDVAANAIGKKGSTTTKDLAKGLRTFGYECTDRCIRVDANKPRPALAIGHLTIPKRRSGWHWVVLDGDKIYDGLFGNPDGTVNWKPGWKITSYLPVH